MEYKIFNKIKKYKLPLFIRFLVLFFVIFIGILVALLPIPGTFIVGILIIIFSFLLVVKGKKIRLIIKIRKGFIYFISNIKNKKIRKYKIRDIKKHIKHIFN